MTSIENESRFARDLALQLTGHDLLKAQGITLLPVDSPDYFTHETPTAVLVRQILGAIVQFEKESSVQKLHQAREGKRLTDGRPCQQQQRPWRSACIEKTPRPASGRRCGQSLTHSQNTALQGRL